LLCGRPHVCRNHVNMNVHMHMHMHMKHDRTHHTPTCNEFPPAFSRTKRSSVVFQKLSPFSFVTIHLK
jgi:hypothetical protein